MANQNCLLCGQHAQYQGSQQHGRRDVAEVTCNTCGRYFISGQAGYEVSSSDFNAHKKALISGVTREQSERDSPITILSSTYPSASDEIGISIPEILDSWVPRSIPDRIDRVLQNLAHKSRNFGAPVEVDASKDRPMFFAEDNNAMSATLKHMVDSGLVDVIVRSDQGGGEYALTVKAWERIEELRRLRPESRQGFVAMWFDDQLKDAYQNGLKPAIEDAGYEPIRVDMAEFNERIDDRIIAEIRRSRFLVADVTEHRAAVYFEAGLAMGLGLPVIFTCHQDHLDECSFDTRQYPHIVWESPNDLKEQLKNRIEATIA